MRWSERGTVVAALAGASLLAATPRAAAQDVADACAAQLSASARSECFLAVGSAGVVQPRLAAALFGGNAVPGTASTLGMRLGSLPRLSLSFRLTGAPAEVPPLADRTRSSGERALLLGIAADAAVGILSGFSPLPTVGGVLSLDGIARVGYVPLPGRKGFHDDGAFGWAAGLRLGALRESFTLPGISLTATYGRIGRTGVGDPATATTSGFFDGAVTDLRLALAATKRVGLIGLTAGVARDRYSSDLTAGFREPTGGPQLIVDGEAVHERWSGYVNASWTLLIFHLAAEAGWQEAPTPEGLPPDVRLEPVGWFAGVAFRVSI